MAQRQTRRNLRRSYPDLGRALERRRWLLPGSGWAAFIYLPTLAMGGFLAPELLVKKHLLTFPHNFMFGWALLLLPSIVIALFAFLYNKFLRVPYIRLLEEAQDASPLSPANETAGVPR